MKKIIALLLVLTGISLAADAQLSGRFYTAPDGHIYFQAMNTTGYDFNVSITATSDTRKESEYRAVGMGFYLGPTTPWRWYWKAGDRITVIYPNGQSVFWECPVTDRAYSSYSPSFRSSGRQYVKTNFGCDKCSCSGYWGYKHANGSYEGACSNTDQWGHKCGHSPEHHGLRSW